MIGMSIVVEAVKSTETAICPPFWAPRYFTITVIKYIDKSLFQNVVDMRWPGCEMHKLQGGRCFGAKFWQTIGEEDSFENARFEPLYKIAGLHLLFQISFQKPFAALE